MAPGARELDELVERRRRLDDLGLGRAAAAHRDDDDVAVAREQPREVRRDRGLPHALARCRSRRSTAARTARTTAGRTGSRRRRTAGPAASACDAQRKRSAGPEHRLVGEVDHDLGVRRSRRRAARRSPRRRAASRCRRRGSRRPTRTAAPAARRARRRVVLPVDQRDRPHRRAVTSRSIRPVYFSYSTGREVELDDPLLPVERVPPPDRDVRARDLDHVVTGPRVAAEPQASRRCRC